MTLQSQNIHKNVKTTENWKLSLKEIHFYTHGFLTEADDYTGVLLEHFCIYSLLNNCIIQKYRLKLNTLMKSIPTQNVYFSG